MLRRFRWVQILLQTATRRGIAVELESSINITVGMLLYIIVAAAVSYTRREVGTQSVSVTSAHNAIGANSLGKKSLLRI